MKKFLLSLAAIAMMGSTAIAEKVVINFQGSEDMYGLTRQTTNPGIMGTGVTCVPEFSFSEDGVDFNFAKDGTSGSGFALVNYEKTAAANGLQINGYVMAGRLITPVITISVAEGKITKSTITYTATYRNPMTVNGVEVASDGAANSSFVWTSEEGEQSIVWSTPAQVNTLLYIKEMVVEYEKADDGRQQPDLSFTAETAELIYGKLGSVPSLNNPYDLPITWTSSNESVATVNENGGVTTVAAGTTKITATFAGNDEYTDAKVFYTLTVIPVANNITQLLEKAPKTGDRVYVDFPMTVTYYRSGSGQEYVTDMYGNATLVRAIKFNTQDGESEEVAISYNTGSIIPQGWIATNRPEAPQSPVRWVGEPSTTEETADVTFPVVDNVTPEDAYKILIIKSLTVEKSQSDDTKYYGTTSTGETIEIRNSFGVPVPVGTWDVKCGVTYTPSMFFIMAISYTEPAKLEFPETFNVTADSEDIQIDQYFDEDTEVYTIELSGTTTNENVALTFDLPEGWDGLIGTQMVFGGLSTLKKRANAFQWQTIEEFKNETPNAEEGTTFTYAADKVIMGSYFLYSGDQVDKANPIQVVVHVEKVAAPEPEPVFPTEFNVSVNDEALEVTQGVDQGVYTVNVSGMTDAETVTVTLEVPEGWDGFLGATEAEMSGGGDIEPLKKVVAAAEDDDMWAPIDMFEGMKITNSLTFDVNGEDQRGFFFLFKGDQVYNMPINIEVNVEKAPEVGTPVTVDVTVGGLGTTQSAKVGDDFSVTFNLDEYWEVSTLTVNGKDALESEGWEDNKYTTAIATDLVINAGLEYTGLLDQTLTGIGEATLGNGVKISVADGEILITDMTVGDEICIYNLAGQVITSTKAVESAAKFKLTRNLVYIVRVGNVAAKVIL